MHPWPNIGLVALAYLFGGISPGYWLVRWRKGVDIRATGSGVTGATNVGRLLGRGGYSLVLGIDIAKGALIAWMARSMGVTSPWAFAAALAVVAGHVWPVWLGFRGGKGIGPFLGAWLVLAPLSLAPCLGLALLLYAWWRKLSISGLLALTLLPASVWWDSHEKAAVAVACLTFSLLLWTHRINLWNFAVARLPRLQTVPAGLNHLPSPHDESHADHS